VPYHFFGSGGIAIESLDWYVGILYWTVTTGLTPLVVVAMLVRIIVPLRVQFGQVFHWWLLAMIVFTVAVWQGNRHLWYQLPMALVAAALAGMAYDFTTHRSTALTRSKTLLTVSNCLLFAALVYLCQTSICAPVPLAVEFRS
jgi:hypothetical protein